jgi:flavin-binding protein dodecin
MPEKGEARMAEHVYRVTEIVGSSPNSSDEALRNALERASKTLRNLDWFEVVGVRGYIQDGSVGRFQVTVKVGFRLEEPD